MNFMDSGATRLGRKINIQLKLLVFLRNSHYKKGFEVARQLKTVQLTPDKSNTQQLERLAYLK